MCVGQRRLSGSNVSVKAIEIKLEAIAYLSVKVGVTGRYEHITVRHY